MNAKSSKITRKLPNRHLPASCVLSRRCTSFVHRMKNTNLEAQVDVWLDFRLWLLLSLLFLLPREKRMLKSLLWRNSLRRIHDHHFQKQIFKLLKFCPLLFRKTPLKAIARVQDGSNIICSLVGKTMRQLNSLNQKNFLFIVHQDAEFPNENVS